MGDALRLGGFLVNPLEIARHIQKVPGISGCQTVAVPRPEGVRAVAFRQAGARCRARRSGHHRPLQARPRQLQGADAHLLPDRRLPQDATWPNGFKIQRTKLREMAEALLSSS